MPRPIAALALSCLCTLLPAQAEPPTTPTTESLRTTIQGAVTWLAAQAVPVTGVDGAALVPSPMRGGEPSAAVYGGNAGILLVLENIAATLDDARARELADKLAKGLRSRRQQNGEAPPTWCGSEGNAGAALYLGDAGVGQAFLVRHQLRKDADALATAVEIGDALVARASKDGGNLSWGNQPDLIIGNAGVALFLLELGRASSQRRSRLATA
jgi:hypothetical protein